MKKINYLFFFLPIILVTISYLFSIQVIIASDPPKPSDQGSPDGRVPAGSRSPCAKTSLAFTPVLPRSTDQGFTGLTLKEHPTFWFFIPYKTESVSSGKFVIRDQDGKTIYRTPFNLPKTPGFVSINIPTTAEPLEKNKSYTWKLVLDCANPNSDQPPDISHEGLITRVDNLALENQLTTANLTQRIKLYIDNEVFYDASSDLVNIREVPDAWLMLLKAIELKKLQQEVISGEVIKMEK